jgi:hypothetical protein
MNATMGVRKPVRLAPHAEADPVGSAPGCQEDVSRRNRIVVTIGVEDSAATERAQG